jgi:hypothetical protein
MKAHRVIKRFHFPVHEHFSVVPFNPSAIAVLHLQDVVLGPKIIYIKLVHGLQLFKN